MSAHENSKNPNLSPRRLVITFFIITALIVFSLLFYCQSQSSENTRLVVLVVVDQMRADYLDSFATHFDGGLKRLLRDGKRFSRAYHNHAATETAVGHAVLATGMLPSHNGITGNYWFDHESGKRVYSCLDPEYKVLSFPDVEGRSPAQLLAPTLGDIAKSLNAQCKVVSLALKDRAAILMGGKNPDAAIWYLASKGKFVTSSYYTEKLPAWIDSLNSSGFIESFADSIWTKVLPDSLYCNRESRDFFPHRFESADDISAKEYYYDLSDTPYGDDVTLELARRAISRYDLGADNDCDFFFISFSAADYIGHAYGPDSPEIEDYYIRLDRKLGDFFANLDSLIGKNRYLVILSSDHGVMPLPEKLREKGLKASRIDRTTANSAIDAIMAEIAGQLGLDQSFFQHAGNQIFLDEEIIEGSGLTVDSLENLISLRLIKLPFVVDVYTASELASTDSSSRPYFQAYANCFIANQSPHIYLRFPEYTLITSDSTGTGHGSPYAYDNHVPIVFMGEGIAPGICDDSVCSIDIAPSIFGYLDIKYGGHFDGRIILDLVNK